MTKPGYERVAEYLVIASLVGFVAFTGATWAIAPPLVQETPPADDVTWYAAGNIGFPGGVFLLDEEGQHVWEYQEDALYHFDVERLDNHRISAPFVTDSRDDCETMAPPCSETGVRVINTSTREVEWAWSIEVGTRRNSEIHDAEFINDESELLVVEMDQERVLIVNTSTKDVVWQWNASQRYDRPAHPTRVDWLHMNDVDKIYEGRYLLSVRNANELVFLDRSCACVVEVVNEGGDPDVLRHQHNPQWLGEGRVLVADSDNHRIVELHRHDSTLVWEPAWTLYSAGGVKFDWPRDADRLENGNTLITDTRNARLVEVDRDGNVVWSAEVAESVYEADRGGNEYPGGPAYEAGGGEPGVRQPFYPVSMLYGALRYKLALPYWVTDWHLLAFVLMAEGISLAALVYVVGRSRSRGPRRSPELNEA